MPKSWKCEICKESVSELGSYTKLTTVKYAHALCFAQRERQAGYTEGREAVLREQEIERARERQAQEERQALERAMEERRAEVAERERVNRIEAQRAMPLPPRLSAEREEAARRAIAEGKSVALGGQEPERPKNRFELIEIDEPEGEE